jgi:hypothetical protein
MFVTPTSAQNNFSRDDADWLHIRENVYLSRGESEVVRSEEESEAQKQEAIT